MPFVKSSFFSPRINHYIGDVAPLNDGATSAVITINFNPSDGNLTSILNSLSIYPFLNVTMYNFLGNSNSLTNDLSWALTQGKSPIS